jgi:hypothetical protein
MRLQVRSGEMELAPLLEMLQLFHTLLAHCNTCCGPNHAESRELAPPASASKGVFLRACVQVSFAG